MSSSGAYAFTTMVGIPSDHWTQPGNEEHNDKLAIQNFLHALIVRFRGWLSLVEFNVETAKDHLTWLFATVSLGWSEDWQKLPSAALTGDQNARVKGLGKPNSSLPKYLRMCFKFILTVYFLQNLEIALNPIFRVVNPLLYVCRSLIKITLLLRATSLLKKMLLHHRNPPSTRTIYDGSCADDSKTKGWIDFD